MRYPISGAVNMWPGGASSGGDNASTGAVLLCHGTATGTLVARGRVFWLRSLWVGNSASGMVVGLADASVSATAANTPPYKKFVIPVASNAIGTASDAGWDTGHQMVSFPPPGLKFTTNCLAYLVAGSGATAGSIGGAGYEE